MNGDSAVAVDLGIVCQLYGEKRVEKLRSIYKNTGIKQLRDVLLPHEKIEIIK